MLKRVLNSGLIACLLSLSVSTASASSQTNESVEIIEHTIEQGQFLNRIATKYNTTVAKLLELNPGLEADKIRAGQKIWVPAIKAAKEDAPVVEKAVVEKAVVEKAVVEEPKTEAKPVAEVAPIAEAKPATEVKSTEEPKKSEELVATTELIEYTVAEGETFSRIVVKHHTTTVRILKHNPGLEPAKIRPGQKIYIPTTVYKKPQTQSVASDPNAAYHVVESGDNLGKIAKAYDTTIAKLKELNEGLDPDKIRIGQKLRVK